MNHYGAYPDVKIYIDFPVLIFGIMSPGRSPAGCVGFSIGCPLVMTKPGQKTRQNKINPKENAGARGPCILFYLFRGSTPPPGNRRGSMARWRVPDVIFFLYPSIVFYLGFPILPYALSFYWHFFLRPLHFIIFF